MKLLMTALTSLLTTDNKRVITSIKYPLPNDNGWSLSLSLPPSVSESGTTLHIGSREILLPRCLLYPPLY